VLIKVDEEIPNVDAPPRISADSSKRRDRGTVASTKVAVIRQKIDLKRRKA